jgi:23S rRNA (guanine745-N1)-methyltransferase
MGRQETAAFDTGILMHLTHATNLACPLDRLPLEAALGQLRCPNGHSFDIAREGYSNLLVVQHKASRDPGDTSEMVAARRRFLDAGHFSPIADAVFEMGRACMAPRPAGLKTTIVDAGCGEGYYLAHFARAAATASDSDVVALAGIDVSKWAVKAAAKRRVELTTSSTGAVAVGGAAPITWLVANNKCPPFLPDSVDLILCLFGFPVWEGFASVQSPGGHVLVVDPGPDHLIELRRVMYPTVTQSGIPVHAAAEAAGYRVENTRDVRFSVDLSKADHIADLVAMTPHGHRLTQAGHDAVSTTQELTVTVDVTLRAMRLAAR